MDSLSDLPEPCGEETLGSQEEYPQEAAEVEEVEEAEEVEVEEEEDSLPLHQPPLIQETNSLAIRHLYSQEICYVRVECSARLELEGYDQGALLVAIEASASGTR